MILAPIVLFVYNRPEHTKKTIEALKKNILAKDSELFVYSDGPKNELSLEKVEEVRDYLKKIDGFKKISIIERDINLGLAGSIIGGVTDIVDEYGKIIVLEDDLVTSPYFLKYMNESLDFYENNKDVISIHGYVYPVEEDLSETFFLKGADCWGWATWKRGWNLFERDGQILLKKLKEKKMTKDFDFYCSYPYTRMLENQILGLNDSWAIRWYASAFLANKLTLYPGRSLVRNIGMDASGTHSSKTSEYNVELARLPIKIINQTIKENKTAKKIFANYFSKLCYNTLFKRFKFTIKKLLLCFK